MTLTFSHIHTNIYTHTYNGVLLSHKKNEILPICSNMDELGGHYAKRNKSEKGKYCVISLTLGIKKIQQM